MKVQGEKLIQRPFGNSLLVDNSVDGARRTKESGDLSGLWIKLQLSKHLFRIEDNCGGISVAMARDWAFRFGRSPNAPVTTGSIGQFGVGMKRTIFKLGTQTHIQSTTSDEYFEVDIDVEEWLKLHGGSANADEWHFEFTKIDIPSAEAQIGTVIESRRLHPSVAENFESSNFITRLQREIMSAHELSLSQHLSIQVNGVELRTEVSELLDSEDLKPAYLLEEYSSEILTGHKGSSVTLRLFAGISDRQLHEGGWYIYCNGRQILKADQTSNTIWGKIHGNRQYHPDFAYFRGYAFFESADASLLPWTTTKTGVDIDSSAYRLAQQRMVEISKPVLEYLTELAKEKSAVDDGVSDDRSLAVALESAKRVSTANISKTPTKFTSPKLKITPPAKKMQKVQYLKPIEEVEKVKKMLQVSTFTAVGEKTFEYYLEYEEAE